MLEAQFSGEISEAASRFKDDWRKAALVDADGVVANQYSNIVHTVRKFQMQVICKRGREETRQIWLARTEDCGTGGQEGNE